MSRLAGLLILAVAGALYLPRLDSAPIYLGGDEAHFAVHAHSIAASGRDLNGRFLPLFINLQGPLGPASSSLRFYQPAAFYAIAAGLTVMPLAEWSVRVPIALLSLVNVALIYFLALRAFRDQRGALVAATMLVLTPAYLIFSRQAVDYLLPIPFVLGWMMCLVRALDTGSMRASFVGGLLLGLGLFSYLAAWVLMPLLLLTGCCALLFARRRVLLSAAALLGFALPAAVLAAYLLMHPAMTAATLGRYSPPGTLHLTPLQRVKDSLTYDNMQEKLAVYWDYFNPGSLFFGGSANLTMGTRQVGVFLIPVAVFLAVGAYDRARRMRHEPFGAVLIAGFALSFVPAVLVGERFAIQRALVVIPFAALIAAYGAMALWRHRSRLAHVVALSLLLGMAIQFAFFCRDYFGEYQVRSAVWFDPADFRAVAEYVIPNASRAEKPSVYLAEDLDDVGARWGFYLAKHDRSDLWERTAFFRADLFHAEQAPAGALLVLYANDPSVRTLVDGGNWSLAKTITDRATGRPSAAVLRKRG